MKLVRMGLIGFGVIGSNHARYLGNGEVSGAVLSCICDINPERLRLAKELYPHVKLFDDYRKMIASGEVDAVFVATPHYEHPPMAVEALKNGLHVLIEKPAGVYTKQVLEMNEVAGKSDRVFGIMYNQRTNPVYQKARDLVKSGELGEIKRTNWIIDWYRPQSYYDSGGWRATWSGEGGGVLLNQDLHQLDLWQWICGMPKRVRAFCYYGKYHNIEVEDDVTAFVEYENGATGVFVTSTAMTPETNRFEIIGDRGKIVIEDGKLTFYRLRVPERQFNREYDGGKIAKPECWKCEIPVEPGQGGQHREITQNFVNAILKGEKLLAPGIEGINGLQISNAMHLSSWLDDWVEIPVDPDLFYEKLMEKIHGKN
ncbi:oxidoreductase [Thermoclostridium stercorarium subsp. thermolacticum DSM 2910]|uniref:Oxidoreductase n=2 Tax=Thermoclostridium stercorarium TaxID=1510 RepID=A0A1B1YKZ5_THEST|nr:Gfo/Idh/MocA family oxidoreductase [Thermoclostridium stercorarium]ANW98931.1 oxidoreductase [Thermoclostridium stercorarium subsp. thermolacticum DSM 2910]ANX01459.1 oxidoreductase [Thermoclostridium stercorarium subsp. leptospartum DSM 9219]UZQ84568.1 Gfo/Idh/MocA family oxidoreductase [Thermoclostridium stercorarium]